MIGEEGGDSIGEKGDLKAQLERGFCDGEMEAVPRERTRLQHKSL